MFNKIMIPSDLSEASMLAMEFGVRMATVCSSELVLLNVRPDFMDRKEMVMLRVSSYDFLEKEGDIAVAAKSILEEELRRAGGSQIKHQTLLREGDPHEEILKTANELSCDLIILTTTGRNHLLEKIKGSDAERLVSQSHVPILVLPVPKDDSDTESDDS